MAATNMIITALCLSTMVCVSFSQRYHGYRPMHSPSARLTQSCSIFTHEKMQQPDEFRGRCNSNVLAKVYDLDEDIYKDDYMKSLFKQARFGRLCYAEGLLIREVRGACDAMELSCNRFTPKEIDMCENVVAAARPPANPPVTTRPNVPATPRGRGI